MSKARGQRDVADQRGKGETHTPGRGERSDVEAREGDQTLLGGSVDRSVRLGVSRRHSDDGDQELHRAHPDGTPDEQRPSTESIDGEDSRDGRDHLREGKVALQLGHKKKRISRKQTHVDDVDDERRDEGAGVKGEGQLKGAKSK